MIHPQVVYAHRPLAASAAVALVAALALVPAGSYATHRGASLEERIEPAGHVRVGTPGSDPAPVIDRPTVTTASTAPAASVESAKPAKAMSGEEVYQSACVACHAAGVANAPKITDSAAWGTRLEQGFDTLVGNAISGKNAMPPRGGNAALSDENISNAVKYMLGKAGHPVDESAPAQPAAPAQTEAPVQAAAAAAPPAAPSKSGEQVYQSACFACHTTGVAGAPKLGDPAAWGPRAAQGLDALVKNAVKGKNAMPPKGGSMNLTEEDVRAAIEFILGKAGLGPG